jgi:twinkle protein
MTEFYITAGMDVDLKEQSSRMTLSDAAAGWLKETRGISRETLELLPAASGITFFADLGEKSPAIFFKYDVGWKARSFPEKGFVSSKGWKPSLWNLEKVLETLHTGEAGCDIYITEGELDALSLVEAGIPPGQVLSVPSGASGGSELVYLADALKAGLNRAKKIIWAGDCDETGIAMRALVAKQTGLAKLWYVEWPEGCKDANDVLIKLGPDYLRNYVLENAYASPVEGMYRMSEIPEPPLFTLWEPEIDCLKGKMWLAPGTLTVVTGQPGAGKTNFFGQLWFEILYKYDLKGCFASFETRPKPHMRRQIRTLFNKMPEYQQTQEELRAADSWAERHYLFMVHPEQRPSLNWFLDQAEMAVARDGAKIIQLDPWNRLEASRSKSESETEYIARCLRSLYVFAQDMNCHVQIIAHPAKMDSQRKGRAPELEDISGSKAWDAMVDQGFVIHRPKLFDDAGNRLTKAKFFVRKSRFEELGYPLSVNIDYDLNTRTYVPDYSSDMAE